MKTSAGRACVLVLVAASVAQAESLPTFHPRCAYDATHIVQVQTQPGGQGRFRVVESWKGDLKKGDPLQLAGLAGEAKGEMVLFLRRDPKAADGWKPASFDWPTSVAWLEKDRVKVVQQMHNPGPAEVLPLEGWGTSPREFKEAIFYYLRAERQLAKVKAERDQTRRVALLDEMINGRFDRQDEAFAELGRCGKEAVPVLRRFLRQPPSHQHKYAVAALAAAGGQDVADDINDKIDAELVYWRKTGPTLHKGWWLDSDSEPWKRYGTLSALVDVYRTLPSPHLRKRVGAVRDFFARLPAVSEEQGIGRLNEDCDRLLQGEK